MSSPLSNLSSDTDGFPTPRKSLWSANSGKNQSTSNYVSDLDLEDDYSSSDADDTTQPTMPSSDNIIVWSSPLVGSKEDICLKKKSKQLREQQRRNQEAQDLAVTQKRKDLMEVLQLLNEKKLRFGDLLEFVFNLAHGQGSICWHQFFARKDEVLRVLDFWVCGENVRQARDTVEQWAVDLVARRIAQEARSVTKSKILQTRETILDQGFVASFSFAKINEKLKAWTPIAMRMIEAFSTSWRAEKEHTIRRKERTTMVRIEFFERSPSQRKSRTSNIQVTTSAALTCLGEYSHSNNISKRMIGLYLYASGAQRQTITVLSTLGLSESYTNIITKNKCRTKTIEQPPLDSIPHSIYTGTLHQLSNSLCTQARAIAATGLYSVVYDNINMMFQSAEQIIGRHGECFICNPLK